MPVLDTALRSSTTSGVGIKYRCRRCLLGEPVRPIWRWIAILFLLAQLAACGFPRPADVGDDAAPPGCSRDQDCSGATPFCVEAACAGCRDNTSCPAGRPVCDMVSHDCRTCAQDSECDSGACDLAAGTCVDQGAVLYASPAGSNADPCTQTSPCSLRHAAELVDASRPYIVLQPGRYSGGANFNAKKATIAGHSAILDIIDDSLSVINVMDGSSISVRDLNVNEHLANRPSDAIPAISAGSSEISIDNMQSNTTYTGAAIASDLGGTLTVRHSTFTGPSLVGMRLIIDNCTFNNGPPFIYGSIIITNSLLIADPTHMSFSFLSGSDPTNLESEIVHNTFLGGAGIDCQSVPNFRRLFDSNIFYNIATIANPPGCEYQYNLTAPNANLGGMGNTTGDPMFRDAPHNDFHLEPGSAAIDAANPADAFASHDFDGTSRPQGTRSDIGAFEYVPSR